MNISELIKKYDIETDDIRWYLSVQFVERLFVKFHPDNYGDFDALVRYIWTGEMTDELYNMEEEFIHTLQSRLDRKLIDVSGVREICREIVHAKEKRYRDL